MKMAFLRVDLNCVFPVPTHAEEGEFVGRERSVIGVSFPELNLPQRVSVELHGKAQRWPAVASTHAHLASIKHVK